jgi:hypothetical protein
MAAYLAVTSHWISLNKSNGCLSLKAALIGFHHLKKKHTSINIARTILYILDQADCYALGWAQGSLM